jgi:hypothetical protein
MAGQRTAADRAHQVRVPVAGDVTDSRQPGDRLPAGSERSRLPEPSVAQSRVEDQQVPAGGADHHVVVAIAVPVAHVEHLGGRRHLEVRRQRGTEVRQPVVRYDDQLAGGVSSDDVGRG